VGRKRSAKVNVRRCLKRHKEIHQYPLFIIVYSHCSIGRISAKEIFTSSLFLRLQTCDGSCRHLRQPICLFGSGCFDLALFWVALRNSRPGLVRGRPPDLREGERMSCETCTSTTLNMRAARRLHAAVGKRVPSSGIGRRGTLVLSDTQEGCHCFITLQHYLLQKTPGISMNLFKFLDGSMSRSYICPVTPIVLIRTN
jgi:hypothetical protein